MFANKRIKPHVDIYNIADVISPRAQSEFRNEAQSRMERLRPQRPRHDVRLKKWEKAVSDAQAGVVTPSGKEYEVQRQVDRLRAQI